jgi:hypothetical protein
MHVYSFDSAKQHVTSSNKLPSQNIISEFSVQQAHEIVTCATALHQPPVFFHQTTQGFDEAPEDNDPFSHVESVLSELGEATRFPFGVVAAQITPVLKSTSSRLAFALQGQGWTRRG